MQNEYRYEMQSRLYITNVSFFFLEWPTVLPCTHLFINRLFLFQHWCGKQLYSLSQLICPSSPSPQFSLRPRCFNFSKPNWVLRESTTVLLVSHLTPAVPAQRTCPTVPENVRLYSVKTKTCWQRWLNSSMLTTDLMSRTAACSRQWLTVRTQTCSWAWRSLSCEQSWPGELRTAFYSFLLSSAFLYSHPLRQLSPQNRTGL